MIIDEAHRGIPDEGNGQQQRQVFFTATPKGETLLSHGCEQSDGSSVPFHSHTQREAVSARSVGSVIFIIQFCGGRGPLALCPFVILVFTI